MMKSLPLLAACLLFPVFVFGAGTAKVRVVNEGRDPVTVSGQTVPRGRSVVVEVPAGAAGEILGQPYPALRSGATYTVRATGGGRGAVVPPALEPSAPAPQPQPAPAPQPTSATVRHPFPKPYVTHCPERVRVVIESRTLGSGDSVPAAALEHVVSAAHHEHVFVYDVATGDLVDDLGWTYEDGGKAFQDRAHHDNYRPSGRELELPGNIYFDVRDAYEAVADRFGYRLVNDVSWSEAVVATVFPGIDIVTPHLKCLAKLSSERRESAVKDFLTCQLFASERIGEDYDRPRVDFETGRLLVNCQLWAKMYFEALEKARELFSEGSSVSVSSGSFRLRRVAADQADLLVRLEEGDGTVTPNSNFSFGFLKFSLENRTKRHISLCIVRVAFRAGMGQNMVFRDIPPGETRPAEEDFTLIGEVVSAETFMSDAFVFPGAIWVSEGGRIVDLFETDDLPTIGYQPLSGTVNRTGEGENEE